MFAKAAQRSKTRITLRTVDPAPPPRGILSPEREFSPPCGGQERAHHQLLNPARWALADFFTPRGHSLPVNAVKRNDVRDFIADQLERWKLATALNRYRSLQAFFKWCVAKGELERSPMVGMKPPQLPDEPPPVLTDDQLRRLLKSCGGRDFAARRIRRSPSVCRHGVFAAPRPPASCSTTSA